MVICFFSQKLVLTKRGRLVRVICQLDVMHNWLSKVPQKSLDEFYFILFYFVQACLQLSERHKMAPLAFPG
jgi:hypothetical protein